MFQNGSLLLKSRNDAQQQNLQSESLYKIGHSTV